MRDLWKGLAMLAVDADLRTAVMQKAKVDDHPDLSPALREQPNVDALREIDAIYRTRGLYLGTYALAEINRWMVKHQQAFSDALDRLRDAIAKSLEVGSKSQNPGFLEAVGVLVADPLLREQFGKALIQLRDEGFQISPLEQDALRDDFLPGSAGAECAEEIFNLGWSSSSCAARKLVYSGLFHFNM
jgi:hypothetical protein